MSQTTATPEPPRYDLEEAIRRSEFIASLADDWDDDGSPGYERATWEHAVGFLRAVARNCPSVPVPIISPADSGTIDLWWQLADRSLLVNFAPSAPEAMGAGRRSDGEKLSGRVDAARVAEWLAATATPEPQERHARD